jgi:uncharacterized SAM-binding protein YcdF (DUF218 family)
VKKWIRIVGLLILVILIYTIGVGSLIIHTWKTAQPNKSESIIVLGAAVWSGKPSLAMRERLDVALQLHTEGWAPYVIVSGGAGLDELTEAAVMKEYLVTKGVPEENVIMEPLSQSTWENLTFSKQIMDDLGFQSAIIVTHGFHTYRALMMADELGIISSAKPVQITPLNLYYYTMREGAAITYYWFNQLTKSL